LAASVFDSIERIKWAVMNGDIDATSSLTAEALERGTQPGAVFDALTTAVIAMGERLSKKEAFLPELVITFEAFRKGADVVRPRLDLPREGDKLKVVIGTVEGDIHNIGKNLVKLMLEVSGCEVYDLGVDIPAEKFAEKAVEVNADVVGCSTLISPGILALRRTVEQVRKLRGGATKVFIGGYATSPALAEEVGAVYCKDAYEAVQQVRILQGEKSR